MSDCPACEESSHPDHSDELKRLNRIDGQINGVRKMIEERHMEHCVADAFTNKDGTAVKDKIAELVELFKKEL